MLKFRNYLQNLQGQPEPHNLPAVHGPPLCVERVGGAPLCLLRYRVLCLLRCALLGAALLAALAG